MHICSRFSCLVLQQENFSDMLPQFFKTKFYKLFYQPFDCPKTNLRSLVRERAINQMLMTQLQEAIQESHKYHQ